MSRSQKRQVTNQPAAVSAAPVLSPRAAELFCKTTGVKSDLLALQLISKMAAVQVSKADACDRMIAATQLLAELNPASLTETMLATQMVGVHEAAVCFLMNATVGEQTIEGRDANTNRAVRLLRVFIEQLEAMAKLKGTSRLQKVVVEHVHVNAGGQAIVGDVTTASAGRGKENHNDKKD